MPDGQVGCDRGDPSIDEVFAALADARRRSILGHLRDNGVTSVDDLAAVLADHGDPDPESRPPYRLSLRHVHLPILADADLVEYDRERGQVRLAPDTELTWLDEGEAADQRPTAPATVTRILQVDPAADEPPVGEGTDGVSVERVETAEAALARLSADAFDCVVTEHELPDVEGLAFVRELASAYPDVPVVVYTDAGSERIASAACLAGAAGYLRKAEGPQAVLDRVRSLVGVDAGGGGADLFAELSRRVRDYALIGVDPAGEIVEWSRGARELTGYDEADVIGEPIDLVLPELPGADGLAERVPDDGRFTERTWVRTADDNRVRARTSVFELEGRGHGVVVNWLPAPLEEVRHAEAVATDPFQLVAVTQPDGTVVDVNRTALEFAGLDRADVVGYPLWGAGWWAETPESREAVRDAVAEASEGSVVRRETRAGGRDDAVPVDFSVKPVVDADGTVVALVAEARDISEVKAREREMREVRAFTDTTLDAHPDPFFLADEDLTLLRWNDRLVDVTGYADDELVHLHPADTVAPDDRDLFRAALDLAFVTGDTIVEVDLVTEDGDHVPHEFAVSRVSDEAGRVLGVAVAGRDVSERKRRTEQLQLLNRFAQALPTAETETAVCERTVEAAGEILETDAVAVDRYDPDTGSLGRTAATGALADPGEDDPLAPSADPVWDVFASGDSELIEPTDEAAGPAVAVALGSHGVLVAGSTELEAARLLGAHVTAALDRVDREQSLRERTAALERNNERLQRMNNLNEVIRGLTSALVDASTREEIERAVVEQLAGSDTYRFAWVGRRDPVSGEVRPYASAGQDRGYLDAITVTGEESAAGEPAGLAMARVEPTVVDRIGADPPLADWQRAAIDRDLRSAIAVPLVYDEAVYGVLALYADETGVIDDLERAVVTELGETVAYAINATERKAALLSDRVVELEFQLTAPDLALSECVRRTGGRLSLEGVVGDEGEGRTRLFFAHRGGSADDAVAFVTDAPGISDGTVVSRDDEEVVFECTPARDGLVATILDHGAVPRSIVAEGEEVEVVVELPASRDVREFAEVLETKYAGASLVARRERDRPIRTAVGFREELTELLTTRQLEAAETAYHRGFFEWPRENTGEEVAAALDVSQPTFNRHLRESQRKLFALLFDEVEP